MRGRLSVHTSTKRLYQKRTRRTRKNEQRTNTKIKAGTFWVVSSVRFTVRAVPSVVIESCRYFLTESRVGCSFLAEAVKPRFGGLLSAVMQYVGNVLAVGGFSLFSSKDFGGRRHYQNMAVNRHITGTPHSGGNFTAGKIPTTTLKFTALLRKRAKTKVPRANLVQTHYHGAYRAG